jgi:hypothetical protein
MVGLQASDVHVDDGIQASQGGQVAQALGCCRSPAAYLHQQRCRPQLSGQQDWCQ